MREKRLLVDPFGRKPPDEMESGAVLVLKLGQLYARPLIQYPLSESRSRDTRGPNPEDLLRELLHIEQAN